MSGTAPPVPPAPRRLGTVAVLASLVLAGMLWTFHLRAAGPATGLFHDGAVYVVTAQALATDAGYRRIQLVGAPAEVKYPPLLPLLLSGVWRLAPAFPANLVALKSVCILAALALVGLLPGYLRRIGLRPEVADATAALTALAPLTTRYATTVASELPFAALTIAALWATERATDPGRRRDAAALAGLLAGLAFLTRTIGLAVVGGCLLIVVLRADRRRVVAYLAPALTCVLPWLVWVSLPHADGSRISYLAELPVDGLPGPLALLGHVAQLPAAIGLVSLPGLADLLPRGTPVPLIALLYLLGAVILAGALRQRFAPTLVLTLGMAVAVPWFQPRFLVPLAPLFLATLLSGLLPTGHAPVARTVRALVLALLVGAAVAGNGRRLAAVEAAAIPALEQVSYPTLAWHEIDDAMQWLRTHTPPDAVVGSFHDPLVYLYTGRIGVQAYPAIWHPEPEQITTALRAGRASYLVDFPVPDEGVWAPSRQAWTSWLATHAPELTLAYESPARHVRIWRVAGTGA